MRNSLRALLPGAGQHSGLLLSRYLAGHDEPKKRSELLNGAIAASRGAEIYPLAFNRRVASFPNDGLHLFRTLRTRSRLIVGLGSDNVLESGIRLDHTYGMPVIPGSALKGLAAHHCHLSFGPNDPGFQRGGSSYSLLFGKTDDGGCIVFEDAWLDPESILVGALKLDVMTPHHPKWQIKGAVAPTDFDSPIPVSFLSVEGSFEVRVSWRGAAHNDAANWTTHAMAILVDALDQRGVGGKTSSGYGRLAVLKPAAAEQRVTVMQFKANDSVEVKLTGNTKAGGWIATHEISGRSGPVIDTNILQGKQIGDTAQVWIASVSPSSIQFKTAQPPQRRPEPPNQRGRR